MPRQSISLSEPNDEWLKAQVESKEYSSKSELVNELIRQARGVDLVRARLIAAEQRELTDQSRDDMLKEFKNRIERDGL